MSRRPKSERKVRRSWLQRGVLCLNVLGVVAAIGTAWAIRDSFGVVQDISRVQLEGTLTPLVTQDEAGQRVINVLMVGSDSTAGLDPNDPIQIARGNTRNGDVIIVAHLDERNGSAALLSIPRDLWVPIAGEGRDAKINNAFAVGGPATLIETIEENFDIPIHHYVNVDFAGFQGLVDAVDEVEIYFDAPMRDFNTRTKMTQSGFEMLESGCQPLNGLQSLQYVRSRYIQRQQPDGSWISEQASDLNRIRRQQDFMRRLVKRAVDLGAKNPFIFQGLLESASENVAIDQELTPAFMLDLASKFDSFEADQLQAYSLPNRFGWVGTSSVLFTEELDAEPILEVFRGAEITDPRTVSTTVVHNRESSGIAAELVAALIFDGFDPGLPTATPLDHPGVQVRFGPDGRQAAELTLGSLGVPAELVEVQGLVGRNVVISVGGEPLPQDNLDSLESQNADGGVSTTVPSQNDQLAATTSPRPDETTTSAQPATDPDHDTSCL